MAMHDDIDKQDYIKHIMRKRMNKTNMHDTWMNDSNEQKHGRTKRKWSMMKSRTRIQIHNDEQQQRSIWQWVMDKLNVPFMIMWYSLWHCNDWM